MLPLDNKITDLPIETISPQSLIPEDIILRNYVKESCGLELDVMKLHKVYRSKKSDNVVIIMFKGYASVQSIIYSDLLSYDWVSPEEVASISQLMRHLSPEELSKLLPDKDFIQSWELYDDYDSLIEIVLGKTGYETIRNYNSDKTNKKAVYAIPSEIKEVKGKRLLRYY